MPSIFSCHRNTAATAADFKFLPSTDHAYLMFLNFYFFLLSHPQTFSSSASLSCNPQSIFNVFPITFVLFLVSFAILNSNFVTRVFFE